MKTETEIKVWDPLVRIFHWSLVLAFTIAYLTGDEWQDVHEAVGYFIGGLLVFRLLWGFVGPRHARFKDFVYSPALTRAYLLDLARGKARRYLGHNPAGGWMILFLLASLTLTVSFGILTETLGEKSFIGDASKEVHEFFANFSLVLVGLHVLGVMVSSRLHHENLVRAMITGRKPLHPDE